MEDDTHITWTKSTGKFGVDMGFISKIESKELYEKLKNNTISKDEAVAVICNSELTEIEKIIVAVNIGEYKNRQSRWYNKLKIYFSRKYQGFKHWSGGLR